MRFADGIREMTKLSTGNNAVCGASPTDKEIVM